MKEYGIHSDSITMTTLITNNRCYFWGLVVETDGSNNAVATVNDGAGGVRKIRITCVGADLCYGAILQKPIRLATGLNVVVSGAGAVVDVLWEPWAGVSE